METFDQNITPIFCIDITLDKNNEVFNGSEFITRTASSKKIEEIENKQENLEQAIHNTKLPLALRVIQFVCGCFSLLILAASIIGGLETSFQNSPLLVIGAVPLGIVWLALHVFSKKREKRVIKEENIERQTNEIDEDVEAIQNELGVPKNAVEVDLLFFHYKVKNEKIIPQAPLFQTTPYINLEADVYTTENELHFATLEHVYSFKKSDIKAITTVNKRISIPFWNKDEEPTDGKFKPYKMTVNSMGDVFFKPYHILKIECENKWFGIYFPCYELEAFEAFTGLSAQNE